jgi:glutathione synthase/RimK-type ligase-like ATP-grasp enzyme
VRVALVSCRELPAWEVDDRPLIAALRARGADVAVVPWDADVDWSGFDTALLRTTWDYWDRVDDFLAWTRRAAAVTRLWHPPGVVAWNVDKTYLRALADRGVPVAPTAWLSPGDADRVGSIVREMGWARAFLKPVVGGSASGTLRFTADDAGLAAAAAHVAASDRDLLLQPYLAEVETFGELSVVVLDGRLTHAVRKVPVAGDYRVQDDHGGTDERFPLDDGLAGLAREILAAASGVLGVELLYGRVDLLRDGERLVLTELELVEPSLFLRHAPEAADVLADGLLRRA